MTIWKSGRQAQSKFQMGQESPERESGQATSRQGEGRCKVQTQRADQVTGAETRRCGQGQKAGQVPGDPSGTECWRVVHDTTTIWQRVSVEELVERRLGDGEDWGRTGESNYLH